MSEQNDSKTWQNSVHMQHFGQIRLCQIKKLPKSLQLVEFQNFQKTPSQKSDNLYPINLRRQDMKQEHYFLQTW